MAHVSKANPDWTEMLNDFIIQTVFRVGVNDFINRQMAYVR